MNRDKVIELAREADLTYGGMFGDELCQWQSDVDLTPYLERFAALVAAHEREKCALICDQFWDGHYAHDERIDEARSCALRIRARGGKEAA